MINLATNEIREFVNFIGHASIPPVNLYVIPGYDTVETPGGEKAFAVYIAAENQILTAGGLTDDAEEKYIVLSSIAHEYYHHIEHHTGVVEYDENEAEAFAENVMELWENYKRFKNKFSNMVDKEQVNENN